jgi:protein-disulfide isomerase
MKRTLGISLLAFVGVVAPTAALAQSPSSPDNALQKEIDDLKTELRSIRGEMEQLKQTIHDLTTPKPLVFDITGAPALGNDGAKLVMIEFSDYQCPYCMDYFSNTYRRLIAEYVKTGRVKYVARDFPVENIHPKALEAAQAARCATEQGKFWEMHDSLFANQKNFASTGIADAATAAGLDIAKFNACFESRKYADAIHKEEDDTVKLGIKGTPAFFIGTPDPANPAKIKLVKGLIGSQPLPAFQQTLDSLLN